MVDGAGEMLVSIRARHLIMCQGLPFLYLPSSCPFARVRSKVWVKGQGMVGLFEFLELLALPLSGQELS